MFFFAFLSVCALAKEPTGAGNLLPLKSWWPCSDPWLGFANWGRVRRLRVITFKCFVELKYKWEVYIPFSLPYLLALRRLLSPSLACFLYPTQS
jgi:hypothetical protein